MHTVHAIGGFKEAMGIDEVAGVMEGNAIMKVVSPPRPLWMSTFTESH